MARKRAAAKTSTIIRATTVSSSLLERYCRGLDTWPRSWMVVLAYIVKLADVGMVQGGYGPRLPLEALRKEVLRNLDCDCAMETLITGFPHLTHTAGAEGSNHLAGSQARSGGEWHNGSILYRLHGVFGFLPVSRTNRKLDRLGVVTLSVSSVAPGS